MTEVTEGDCIDSTLTEGISVETVVIVLCSGQWEYRVLGSYEVSGQGNYPGEDYFGTNANENCDRRFSHILYPLEELWVDGDRTVSCLQASFGLSVAEPTKLDRLVGVNAVELGECYNDAPETEGILVELVDCSGPWEYRVLGTISVDDQESYPARVSLRRGPLKAATGGTATLLTPSKASGCLETGMLPVCRGALDFPSLIPRSWTAW